MSFFYRVKNIKPRNFIYPKEFIDFRGDNNFESLSPLWKDLFGDVIEFIDYYDFLLDKFPQKRYIPFACAVDESGLFNDGYVIISAFSPSDDCIFIYDVNNEFSGLKYKGDFSNVIYSFEDWVKFSFDILQEFKLLHAHNE